MNQGIASSLPHSKEAERAVLGANLVDAAGAAEVLDRLEPNDFFLPCHKVIFKHMKRLRALGMPTNDLVLLFDAINHSHELDAAGGAPYIASLADGQPRVCHVPHYSEIVKTNALGRNLVYALQSNIDKILSADGNLADVIREIIHSAPISMKFGRQQSCNFFKTAAELVNESKPPEFVVKPYVLAEAVTELVAKIKAGKTTYVLAEIVSKALDRGPVVYLTEQPQASFRVALGRAGLNGRENLHLLLFNAVIGKEWPEIARIAADKCRETAAVLLVVDTLSHFAGLDGDSENDSGAAIACMKPLQGVATSGTAVLSIRHERKAGGELGDSGRGSCAFGGAADTLLTLRRPEGRTRPTIRKIECISRFEGLPATAMCEFVGGHYQYLGTETEIADREAEAVILGAAPDAEGNAKTLDALLDGSETARTTSQRAAKRLVAEGSLIQVGKGTKGNPFRYFLPEKDSAQTPHIYGQKENRGSTPVSAIVGADDK